jgi:hypothetical protein
MRERMNEMDETKKNIKDLVDRRAEVLESTESQEP